MTDTQATTSPAAIAYNARPVMPAYMREHQALLSDAISVAAADHDGPLLSALAAEHDANEAAYRR